MDIVPAPFYQASFLFPVYHLKYRVYNICSFFKVFLTLVKLQNGVGFESEVVYLLGMNNFLINTKELHLFGGQFWLKFKAICNATCIEIGVQIQKQMLFETIRCV